MKKEFEYFWSGPFSQWYKSDFTYNGVDYCTAEQAMMHAKALMFDDHDIAGKIMQTDNAKKQKALGRKVKNFDHRRWTEESFDIVVDINVAKFSQNNKLNAIILKTKDRQMVEASPYDKIWGIGLDEAAAKNTDPEEWPGQNKLGLALDEVKHILKLM